MTPRGTLSTNRDTAMTEKQAYSSTVLRNVHDVASGESLNVGVVMHAPATDFLKVRTRRTPGRLKQAFPDLDGAAFAEAMQAVECGLSALVKQANTLPPVRRGYRIGAAGHGGDPFAPPKSNELARRVDTAHGGMMSWTGPDRVRFNHAAAVAGRLDGTAHDGASNTPVRPRAAHDPREWGPTDLHRRRRRHA